MSATDISGVTCYGAVNSIGSSSGGQDQWIVGDAFLRNVYVAFQFSPPAVGFAPLATAASVATTPTVVIPVTPSPMASAIAIETATDSAVASTRKFSSLSFLSIQVQALTLAFRFFSFKSRQYYSKCYVL